MVADVRLSTSAVCSGVGAVLPVHGARLLLLPTMSAATKPTPARCQRTFSGMPRSACDVTGPPCLPRGRPGCGKNPCRPLVRRSRRLYPAIVGAVAVGPLGVAHGVDQRVLKLVEVTLD